MSRTHVLPFLNKRARHGAVRLDPRLAGHLYRGIMGCYVGVPVRTGPAEPAGTLCHFDNETHTLPDDEYFLLERVASLLPAFLAG